MSDETTTPDYTPGTGGPGDAPVYPLQSLSHGRDRTLFASQYGGLTLRQWYAGQALAGVDPEGFSSKQNIATYCVEVADAMVAALKGGGT